MLAMISSLNINSYLISVCLFLYLSCQVQPYSYHSLRIWRIGSRFVFNAGYFPERNRPVKAIAAQLLERNDVMSENNESLECAITDGSNITRVLQVDALRKELYKSHVDHITEKDRYIDQIIFAATQKEKNLASANVADIVLEMKKAIYRNNRKIVSLPLEILQLQHELLTREYQIPEDMIYDLLTDKQYPLSGLSQMVTEFLKRKETFNHLQLSFGSKGFLKYLSRRPEILSLPPQQIYGNARGYLRGYQFSSMNEVIPLLVNPTIFHNEETIVKNSQMLLSLLTSDDNFDENQETLLSSNLLDLSENDKMIDENDQEEFNHKYQKLIEYQPTKSRSRGAKNKLAKAKEEREKMENEETLFSHFAAERRTRKSSGRTIASERIQRIWSFNAQETENRNPYYEVLQVAAKENRRLLDNIPGIKTFSDNKIGNLASIQWGMDVIESMTLSRDEAKKAMINGNIGIRYFSTMLEKLLRLSILLRFTAEEMREVITRAPKVLGVLSLEENILPKLNLLTDIAEKYLEENKEENQPEELAADGEAIIHQLDASILAIDACNEYYRQHPVISLVRESILQNSLVLHFSLDRWKQGIEYWNTLPMKHWLSLNSVISNFGRQVKQAKWSNAVVTPDMNDDNNTSVSETLRNEESKTN